MRPDTEIILERFAEEAEVFKQDNHLLPTCESDDEWHLLHADKLTRLSRINSLLDYYNENILGISYG